MNPSSSKLSQEAQLVPPSTRIAATPWRRRALVLLLAAGSLALIALAAVMVYPQWRAFRHWRAAHQAIDVYDFPGARNHLQSCLETWPRSASVHFLLARTARRGDDLPLAERHLRAAEAAGWPQAAIDLEYLMIEVQATGARTASRQLLAEQLHIAVPPDDLCILEALTRGCISTYQMKDVQRWVTLWAERYPQDWRPHLWHGQALERALLHREAADRYRQALAIKPGEPEAWRRLAWVVYRLGFDYQEAHDLYTAYVQAHPSDPEGLAGLARCQRSVRQPEAARATLQRLLQIAPNYADGWAVLALIELDAENDDQALACLRRAEQLSPHHLDVLRQFVPVLRQMGRHAEAEEYLRRFNEAYKDFDTLQTVARTISANPQDAAARCTAGRILLRFGEEQDGLRWLESALREDPRLHDAHQALAEYYTKRTDAESQTRSAYHRRQAEATAPRDAP